MKKRALGTTGLKIFPLVYGTLPMGPLQAALSPAEGGKLIRHAVESGINMLDTAELYETYAHIRAGLDGYSGDVVIVTKSHSPTGPEARRHVERALRELGREQLDVVHLHGARIRDPFTERREVLDELLALKAEGKIAHVGLSSHYIAAIRSAASHPEIEIIHPLINRTGMGILDGTSAEMAEAIAACAAAGKGVYAMKALAGGNLIAEARSAFRYVLDLHGVHGVAVGMLSEREIDANIALFADGTADDSVWTDLEKTRRRLKIMDRFCKGCGFCVEACPSRALAMVEGKAAVEEEACVLCGYCGAACPEFIIRVV